MQSNPLIRATLGITWALCGLGTLLVGIRLFFVALRKSPPTWDFFWILVSTALSIACQVLIMLSVQRGAGQHLDQTPLDEIMPIVSIFFKMCSIGVATACTAKLAVVALFMRMERPSASKFWPWLMYSMAVGVVMAGIVQIGMVEVSREQIKTIADVSIFFWWEQRLCSQLMLTFYSSSTPRIRDCLTRLSSSPTSSAGSPASSISV